MKDLDKSIEVIELTKEYGSVKAIQNLSFSVERGNIVGFLGPNGAGKSTTMRILCGLSPGTSGRAYIEGTNVALHPQKAKGMIGFMPENNPLPEDVRVVEYLRHRARLKGVRSKDQKNRIEEVMDLCDLTRKAQRKIIGTLSKGFRQRVGIADCLLGRPKVLLLDEPTIGLDPHQILSIRNLIKGLKGKMTIIISSHILPEIEASCDYSIIINKGHIVAEGTAQALRNEFAQESTLSLIVKAEMDALKQEITQINPSAHISKSSTIDGYSHIDITTTQMDTFNRKIVDTIMNHNEWELQEVARHEPTLEDIFITATRPAWTSTLPNKDELKKDAA